MTTNHHTPITTGAPADAESFNAPLSELDTKITNHETRIVTIEGDLPTPSGNPTEYFDGNGNFTVPAGTGASVDGHLIKDEGIALPQRASIDFVGAGVTVTNEAGGTQVEIPGASLPDGDYTDVQVSGGGTVFEITAGAVTLAKIVNASGQYKVMVRSSAGAGVWEELASSADVFSMLAAANFAAMRALLDLEIGVDLQAYNANLTTWAGKTVPSGTVVGTSDTQTLTNKRITKRPVTVTQSATPTINTGNGDLFIITGLAQDITSLTSGLSGTPSNGDTMNMHITDNGTIRNITPGASFIGTTALSLTGLATTANKILILLWQWNSSISKWVLVGKDSVL